MSAQYPYRKLDFARHPRYRDASCGIKVPQNFVLQTVASKNMPRWLQQLNTCMQSPHSCATCFGNSRKPLASGLDASDFLSYVNKMSKLLHLFCIDSVFFSTLTFACYEKAWTFAGSLTFACYEKAWTFAGSGIFMTES